jgi:hypothetical protein
VPEPDPPIPPPEGEPIVIATLARVGRRVINFAYLVLADDLSAPDPEAQSDESLTEVTMYQGKSFLLRGREAREFNARLAAFVPRPPSGGSGVVTRTKAQVEPGRGPVKRPADRRK